MAGQARVGYFDDDLDYDNDYGGDYDGDGRDRYFSYDNDGYYCSRISN